MNEIKRDVKIVFPEYVCRIIERLSEAGYDSYAVGGCVRDSILEREPKDWDVTTSAEPSDVMRVFSNGDIHIIDSAGVRHGTVMVKALGEVCEITTFRSDGEYTDHRRPDSVTFSKKIEDDLARRDFTMNAVAAKPSREGVVIVDPYGGVDDIRRRLIRAVGDPCKRYGEDALRIMRAVRFTSELGFDVDPDCIKASESLCDTLEYISAERITAELVKALSGEYLQKSVDSFGAVFRYLMGSGGERFFRLVGRAKDPYVRLALMADLSSNDILLRLRLPTKVTALVKKLLSINDAPKNTFDVCQLMRAFEEDIWTAFEYICVTEYLDFDKSAALKDLINRIIGEMLPYKLSMLAVNGRDVADAGFTGESIGDVLEYLLKEVQEGRLKNEKACLMRAIERIKNQ